MYRGFKSNQIVNQFINNYTCIQFRIKFYYEQNDQLFLGTKYFQVWLLNKTNFGNLTF